MIKDDITYSNTIKLAYEWSKKYITFSVACDTCMSNNHFVRCDGNAISSMCDICGVRSYDFLNERLPDAYKFTQHAEWVESMKKAMIKDEFRAL